MLSNFQLRKIDLLFDLWDENSDSVFDERDFQETVVRIADVFGVTHDSPQYAVLYEAQRQTFQQLMQYADSNADGQVTPVEYRVFWDNMLGADPGAVVAGLAASHVEFWKEVDPDGGDNTTLERWRKYLSAHNFPASKADEAFAHCDFDGDGVISPAEAVVLITQYFGDDPDAPGNWFFGALD